MKRFYRLTDDPKKLINIDDISMIDFDESINKYMILISGLKHCIMSYLFKKAYHSNFEG